MDSREPNQSSRSYPENGQAQVIEEMQDKTPSQHRWHPRDALLDALLETLPYHLEPAASITSHLIFGSQIESNSKPRMQSYEKMASTDGWMQSAPKPISKTPPSRDPDAAVQVIALNNAWNSLRQLQLILSTSSMNIADQSIIYQELAIHIKDIGSLLALSSDPALSYSLVDVGYLLTLVTHLLAARKIESWDFMTEGLAFSAIHLCGGLFASRRGILELTRAFEDVRLEQAWLKCLFGGISAEHSFISEIRQGPGALALAESVKDWALDADTSPLVHVTMPGIGVATTTLLDAYRISQVIVQLQLGDMEQVRRHSDTLRRACLDLAKLCTYESGREALCAATLETPLPHFLIALERHSTAQAISETARYLTIQIFQTALQYRSLLSHDAEDVLVDLFRHIEPSTLSPIFFCRPANKILSPHIDVLLEAIDHSSLLVADVSYTCQLYAVLSTLASVSTNAAGCASLVTALSDRRLPYSSIALFCATLDEVVSALSLMNHGQEVPPGYLQFVKPPFPYLDIDHPATGTTLLQQSDAKLYIFRSAIFLCEIILHLLRFHVDPFDESQSSGLSRLNGGLTRYVVKTCIRLLNVCRGFAGNSLALNRKLEGAALKILASLVSVEFPTDITSISSLKPPVMEITLEELLTDGHYSPRSCETAAIVLNFLTTDWRSKDLLINNRLVGEFRECLTKLRPEVSEWLSMWDGNIQHAQWLLAGGQCVMMAVWEELISRAEFWIFKGHFKYILKWLTVLRSVLMMCKNRKMELTCLDNIVRERNPDMSFEMWIERISSILSESEVEILEEIEVIVMLCRELPDTKETLKLQGSDNIDDLIYVNCADYMELTISYEPIPTQRSASPCYWRERLSPERGMMFRDDVQQSSGQGVPVAGSGVRNGGGGKIYTQNEFRSAHGTSRNTSRAPSVHVDDFYSAA